MCGIAGIWQLNGEGIQSGRLESFTDALYHRGPDDSGYEFFENRQLGLRHRRLSILDLSEAGRQPMSYAEGRYWICYNGEIFNFVELKEELRQAGFEFKTTTDTEVILAAYIHWG
jgi:asparagine synthase (glutamine-hydrolysing)